MLDRRPNFISPPKRGVDIKGKAVYFALQSLHVAAVPLGPSGDHRAATTERNSGPV